MVISLYDDKEADSLTEHANFILGTLSKKKIIPTRSLYSKLIRAYSRPSLSQKLKNLLGIYILYYNNTH